MSRIILTDADEPRRGNTFEMPQWVMRRLADKLRMDAAAMREFASPVVLTDERGRIVPPEPFDGLKVGDVITIRKPERYR